VIAWWAWTLVVPARSVRALACSRAPAGVVVESPGGRLPGQHLHGHGSVGRIAEPLAELGRLEHFAWAGWMYGAPVSPRPPWHLRPPKEDR